MSKNKLTRPKHLSSESSKPWNAGVRGRSIDDRNRLRHSGRRQTNRRNGYAKSSDAGEFFNLRRQAENNPWAVFGCSVAAGLPGRPATCLPAVRGMTVTTEPTPDAGSGSQANAQEPDEKHGWLREQLGSLASGLAVGSLIGVLRDLASRNLPDGLGKNVAQEVDRFSSRLGGKPLSESSKQPAV